MTSYTPTAVQVLIDNLDIIYRNAVLNGTIKEVFQKEWVNFVSYHLLEKSNIFYDFFRMR